ncbi:MAG: DUF3318 domain-containing protein [Oscillatoriales cyanobacterium RM2_1_1]|nr:DUF3318 domain-containing protein [Oscillatoriales cyanobacterium SM2_3_0]NJO47041.1 DUF3318 domain-containing protein [Oscillatoriales cyanobacterium RM2_1_1]
MNQDDEIRHLLELMPASGRMMTQLTSKPQQSQVIEVPFPYPWSSIRRMSINFDLWQDLSRSQRDLMLLRTVSWVTEVKWIALNLDQGIVLAGAIGTATQIAQQDAFGVLIAGGLCALGVRRIWQANHRSEIELKADEAAVRVAQRRGYTEPEAALALLKAIEKVSELERRPGLTYMELMRCQNLRALAKLSPIAVPPGIRQE